MALFGAPIAHEDHAQRACHTALAILRALVSYGEEVKREYGMNFQMRIGLNSGTVVVGAIGDDLRMDYTAMGDTTNLAARMKPPPSRTAPWSPRALIDWPGNSSSSLPDTLLVKGKQGPVKALRLLPGRRRSTRGCVRPWPGALTPVCGPQPGN